jgi:hypothetical protein
LGGEENTEGQAVQEVSRGEQASHRAETEASLSLRGREGWGEDSQGSRGRVSTRLQELGDVLGLWNAGVAVAAVAAHEAEGVQELVAGVFGVQGGEAVVHSSPTAEGKGGGGGQSREGGPGGDLIGGVVDVWDGGALKRRREGVTRGRERKEGPGCSSWRWRRAQLCGCGRLSWVRESWWWGGGEQDKGPGSWKPGWSASRSVPGSGR